MDLNLQDPFLGDRGAQRSQGKSPGYMTEKGHRLALWVECEMTL